MDFGAIIGAGIQVVSGIIGFFVQQGRMDEAKQLYDAASARYGKLSMPSFERMADQTLSGTAMDRVQADPAAVAAQHSVLDRMVGLANQTGLSVPDRVAVQEGLSSVDQQQAAARARVLDSMRARGLGGSGLEVAAQLSGAQQQAQSANRIGSDAVANAQRRALDALSGAGGMASNLRSQSFSEGAQKAQAEDAIAKYNAAARERGTMYRNSVAQQQFSNQMGVADHQANIDIAKAGAIASDGKAVGQAIGGAGQGVAYGMANVLGQPQAPTGDKYGLIDAPKRYNPDEYPENAL